MATLTVAGTSIGLSSCTSITSGVADGIPDGATEVFITCRTADVYWRGDGTTVTASSTAAHTLYTDERIRFGDHRSENIGALRFIRAASTSATLLITFR
jgi:hypothetical protein